MQIKHTFLFTLLLGLAWTGYVFAHVLGPDPGVNGIFGSGQTCNTSGCHEGNPTNDGVGSVSISGLPAEGWTPGQVYALTVTIQRTGQRLFGFELSAVADTTNQQAGTLTAGSGRVRVICGRGALPGNVSVPCTTPGAIQYAEHADARTVTSSYPVNWTAPSSSVVGTVRFNVAGNAANGDGNNTGDYIYTRVFKVDPASAGPPPPDLSTRAFSLVNLGGTSVITDGSGDLSLGYSRIQPGAGSTTPSGVAIFGLRQNNILVTEAGVPASVRLTAARIYAEFSTAVVDTGVAIANPNDQPATINFHFTDGTGATFGDGSFTILPNQQISKFIDQDPFNLNRPTFQGTLTLTSNIEVSLIALRGFYNERTPADFLITTLPVTNLSTAPGTGPVYLAHFASGSGWTTQVVLVNPSEATITGTIQFFGTGNDTTAGAPLTVNAGGQTATSFNYSIPKQSSFKLVTGVPPSFLVGSVRVTPTAGASPSSLIVFSFKPATITVAEAGVPANQGTAFRMYAEETSAAAVAGAIQTGFAIANLGSTAASVTLELTTLDGTLVRSVQVSVPANGQISGFLHDKFPGFAFPFKGLLRINGGTASLSVVGLRGRYNERATPDFLITTTPPTNESDPASAAELLFPDWVNGGGYTTQFILFSGTAGQASSGNLKFLKFDGTAFSLTVN